MPNISEELMNNNNIRIEDIEYLISNQEKESLFLEYKSGDWLQNNDDSKFKLRKWVSSFANSAGGTFIIGVSETETNNEKYPDEIDGIDSTGFREDIGKWIEDVLTINVYPRLNPPPRISILPDNNQKFIAIIQIKPTNFFIHKIMKNGKDFYFHRHNFQVLPMDEWEIRTLLFGRNPPPILEPTIERINIGSRSEETIGSYIINIKIENVGWRMAKYLQFGFIRPFADLVSNLWLNNTTARITNKTKNNLPDNSTQIFEVVDGQDITNDTIILLEPNFLHPYDSIEISYELKRSQLPKYNEFYFGFYILAENLNKPEIYEIKISNFGGIETPSWEFHPYNDEKIKILAHNE